MKPTLLKLLAMSTVSLSSSVFATGSALVNNGNNDGAGSLRAALNSGASFIRISRSVPFITITEPLEYKRTEGLTILAAGQTIDASALAPNDDILSITEGADLRMSNLSLVGGSTEINPEPSLPQGGIGLFVNVPQAREGIVRVVLNNVSVSNVGNHGIHVSDCALRDDCGGGSGGGGQGSEASVLVRLNRVMVNNVGFGRQDADGVRVDERGNGDIYFTATQSRFMNVGADGVELDEGNNGDVIADVSDSVFDSNGEYCVSIPFVAGSPCDDDGDADVDDGFDIDEAGSGTLYARIIDSEITNNFDEGLDFDEEDEGGIALRISGVKALGNADEGVKASEEGEGSLRATLRRLSSFNNNGAGDGVELEEEDAGDVFVRVEGSVLIGGDNEALEVVQEDEGEGLLKVRGSQIQSFDLEGVSQI